MIGAFMPVNLRRQADALDLLVPHRQLDHLNASAGSFPLKGASPSDGEGAIGS